MARGFLEMEAIILAGGFGTRLKSVVSDVPKPMALVRNKPFLEYLLEYLTRFDIERAILSVGYKWECIRNHFGGNYKSIKLEYSIEESPLGTGGAIKKAMGKTYGEKVLILNGDSFFAVDLNQLKLQPDSRILLTLKPMKNFSRYGNVVLDSSGKIMKFVEKENCEKGLINGGVYVVKKTLFDSFKLPVKFSFEEFLMENLERLNITTQIFSESFFIDIGIPEDYLRAENEMLFVFKSQPVSSLIR